MRRPRQRLPKLTEMQIQGQIKNYLRAKGWFTYKNHQTLGSHKGVADLTAMKDGKVVFIEVKKPGGSQSEYQKQFEQDCREHGIEYTILTSLNEAIFWEKCQKLGS